MTTGRLREAVSRLKGTAGLLHPTGTRFYRSLLVVDVDLDTGKTTEQVASVCEGRPPEGVHAIVWQGGLVVGQVTLQGNPAALLPDLAEHAARQLTGSGHGAPSRRAAGPCSLGPRDESALTCDQVTVAVCTRDRPELARDCLIALSQMTSQVAEILLVDNASRDDRTREVTEEFPSVTYIWEPRRGLDWARNRALAEARTAVVAFTDDDALVHPGWVDGLLRAFRDEPEAVIVTGLVLPAELATPAQILFEGRGGFGRGLERKWFSRGLRSGSLEPAFDVVTGSAGAGANMAVRRQRLCDLGGFDLALDVGTPSGGGGDLEALFRVVAAGDLVVYEPSAVVRHRHRASMADLTRQRRGDGTGTYSIFLGAGSRCAPAIRRRFLGLALWWLAKRHLRRAICSVLWPELWPPSLVAAEIRGVLDATFGRYYARGLEQARQDALRHSTEVPVPGIAALSPCRQR